MLTALQLVNASFIRSLSELTTKAAALSKGVILSITWTYSLKCRFVTCFIVRLSVRLKFSSVFLSNRSSLLCGCRWHFWMCCFLMSLVMTAVNHRHRCDSSLNVVLHWAMQSYSKYQVYQEFMDEADSADRLSVNWIFMWFQHPHSALKRFLSHDKVNLIKLGNQRSSCL